MTPRIRQAFDHEYRAARDLLGRGDSDGAFRHLERAHIVAQRYSIRHAAVHWWMLSAGIAKRDWREVAGQVGRMVAALLFSRIWVPLGNTGRANVSAFAPMQLPDDLRWLCDESAAGADAE